MPNPASRTTRKPRGRRPGGTGVADVIRARAAAAFRERGFDGVTVRDIAALADVDAALIFHYFKTKRGLFEASIEVETLGEIPALDATRRTAVGNPIAQSVGERIVYEFVATWDRPNARITVSALLRSVGSDIEAKNQLVELIERTIIAPTIHTIDPKRGMAKLRAALVAAQLIGIAWTRYVLELAPIATASPTIVARTFGESIDATLRGSDYRKR